MFDSIYCAYTLIFFMHCALYVFYDANKDDSAAKMPANSYFVTPTPPPPPLY